MCYQGNSQEERRQIKVLLVRFGIEGREPKERDTEREVFLLLAHTAPGIWRNPELFVDVYFAVGWEDRTVRRQPGERKVISKLGKVRGNHFPASFMM